MDTEGNMLSEISPTEKDKYNMISLTFGILKINKQTNQKQTHRYREQDSGSKKGKGRSWKDENDQGYVEHGN